MCIYTFFLQNSTEFELINNIFQELISDIGDQFSQLYLMIDN